MAHYADNSEPRKIFGSGFKIGGEKYVTIRADERSLYGKKVGKRQKRRGRACS